MYQRVRMQPTISCLLITFACLLMLWSLIQLFSLPRRRSSSGSEVDFLVPSQPLQFPIIDGHVQECLDKTRKLFTDELLCVSPVELEQQGCLWQYIVAYDSVRQRRIEMINPSYVGHSGSGLFDSIEQAFFCSHRTTRKRWEEIDLSYIDGATKSFQTTSLSGDLATCIQHSIDILNGNFNC